MAPNRKQIAVALDPFVSTQPLVQAKYLPLTTEVSTPAAPAPSSESTIIRSNQVDDDYWAWEANSSAAPVDLFSTDRYLVLEAARLSSSAPIKTTVVAQHHQQQEHVDYWAERVEAHCSQENANVSNTTGYWEWPEDSTPIQIALLLKEEFARQLTSGARMEERLQQDALCSKHTLPHNVKAENDDYWSWDCPTTVHAQACQVSESYWEWNGAVESQATQQQNLVAALLAYETARVLLSSDHIVELLEASAQTAAAAEESHAKPATDSYWNWPAEEDNYWNMRPLPAAVVAEAPKGYWDW